MRSYFIHLYWQMRTHPPTAWMGALLFLLYASALLDTTRWLFDVALWLLLPCLVIDHPRLHGKIPFLSVSVGRYFYGVRSFAGWYGIFQLHHGKTSCKEMRRSLSRETALLEHLAVGRYRTLTHATVIRRLEKQNDIVILRCLPAYRSDLKRILGKMTHGECRNCSTPCSAHLAEERQFYFVEFMRQDGVIVPQVDNHLSEKIGR